MVMSVVLCLGENADEFFVQMSQENGGLSHLAVCLRVRRRSFDFHTMIDRGFMKAG